MQAFCDQCKDLADVLAGAVVKAWVDSCVWAGRVVEICVPTEISLGMINVQRSTLNVECSAFNKL